MLRVSDVSQYSCHDICKICVFSITRLTHPFFAYRLMFFLLCDSKFCYGGSQKKDEVYEVLKTKFSTISAKIDNFRIFEENNIAKKIPTNGFVGLCDQKHTYLLGLT